MNKPTTKILVDGGDPAETLRIEKMLGFQVDGQTTNPSLIAKNPEIVAMIKAGHRLSEAEEDQEYKKIVQSLSPVVGSAGVSIEVFSDLDTTADKLFAQGKQMFTWIPNAYIKYPCTKAGLQAAHWSIKEGMRVNITLCFSQEQAAAVYAATRGAKRGDVYVSPFIGRLDDRGENGMDLVKNILEMYKGGDGHVEVLAASIRSLEHLMYCFALKCDLATVPTKVLEAWVAGGMQQSGPDYVYNVVADGKPLAEIPYREISLDQDWQSYDISHPLTEAGIKKFVQDYHSTLKLG